MGRGIISTRWVNRPSHAHARRSVGLLSVLVLAGVLVTSTAPAQSEQDRQLQTGSSAYPGVLSPQAPLQPLGLPNTRPRLTLSMPLTGRLLGLEGDPTAWLEAGARPDGDSDGADRISWSLKAWQLNTASLAHIQCQQHSYSVDSFLAKNCHFVDQPVPDNAVNLVQIQGEWTAAPNLSMGVSLFRSEQNNDALSNQLGQPLDQIASLFGLPSATMASPEGVVEGVSANVSFGIEVERVGEFLLGLQLARYRQRSSLMDLGDPREWAAAGRFDDSITNAAQLSLAFQRGNFRGDLLGRYVDEPIRLGQVGAQTITAPASGFDLEFSWQPGNTSSFSIGVTNVLDQSAKGSSRDTTNDEGVHDFYGRIPYVRYKQDL